MDANSIVSKSTKLGAVTRKFEKSMEDFSRELNGEIKNVKYAVESNRGWQGELYDTFHKNIIDELNELEKLSNKSSNLAAQLEKKAIAYDQIIAKLTSAGGR